MKKLTATLLCLGLAGCNTIQNQYVDATGTHGSGTTTMSVTMTDGKFSISDRGATCSGTFPNWTAITVVFPVACTDGKRGTVTMSRPTAGVATLAGEGTMALTNGEARRFVFGPK